MITIICIGVVIALAALAVVLKTGMSKPQKAQKAEKAAIMKQLLALSDAGTGNSATAPSRANTLQAVPAASANSTPRTKAQKRAAKHLSKPVIRAAAQPVHPNQGRC
jgi:flagellar basal body-associated protein FliL